MYQPRIMILINMFEKLSDDSDIDDQRIRLQPSTFPEAPVIPSAWTA